MGNKLTVAIIAAIACAVGVAGCSNESSTTNDGNGGPLRAAFDKYMAAYNSQNLDELVAASCSESADDIKKPTDGKSATDVLKKDLETDGKIVLDDFVSPFIYLHDGSAWIVSHYENDAKNGAVLPNPPIQYHFKKESGDWRVCGPQSIAPPSDQK
ncbi:Rv0361 family membrane protein [Nocardia sp. CDC160]|uniref:Rv0361 family membrane protein n=1 Tax=Nocardia sp. CDC160 TaxID=3112166 RepID=UPI002DBC214B|nr:hypothetical protein [Nocardia sp. CDC160]MEC3920301.1 hypothetical protein [Nocardia sp. CDC160]